MTATQFRELLLGTARNACFTLICATWRTSSRTTYTLQVTDFWAYEKQIENVRNLAGIIPHGNKTKMFANPTHYCEKCMATGDLGGHTSKTCDYPPHHFVPIPEIQELPVAIVQTLSEIKNDIRLLSDIMVDSSVPELKSNQSDHAIHQENFKSAVIKLYDAANSTNPNEIKCLILDKFFSKDMVKASHIIAVDKTISMALVGMSYWDRYNARNGLLLYAPIGLAFENLDVAFLVDPSTGTFSLHVLYDSMLNQPVENYGKPDPQFKPDENAQLVEGTNPGTHILWRDLHKKPLVTRAGVCPYCTALLWIARRAIERAKKSGRPLVPLAITENDWSIMFSCLLEAPQDTLVMKRWLATQ